MSQKPIALVVGDVMLDVRTEGVMSSVSLEAPAPVVRQSWRSDSLGGAGNVARNIKALGHEVLLLGMVGNDAAGVRVAQLAADGGIPACLPQWDRPTIVKHRVTCNGQIVARVDEEDTTPSSVDVSGLLNGLYSLTATQLEMIKVIVVADYNKYTMTAELVTALRQLSTLYSIPIFVDARPQKMDLYHNVDVLKQNMREARLMLQDVVHPGLSYNNDRDTLCGVACQQLKLKYGARLVVVTDGENGCHYTDPDNNYRVSMYNAVGRKGTVRDVCGAGDTTMAALVVGTMEALPFPYAVGFAMDAAGYVVQFHGVKAADRDELDQFIYEHGGWTSKLMTHDTVVKFIARHRRMNPSSVVVLTNGCFDGFHAGHLEMLRFASKQGTIVIVAYNDDQSLQQLKGLDRPHVPDSYRSTHLAMQDCVSAVVRFDGDAAKLVRQLKPDVLVKGAEAARAVIPGADFMAQHGGRVELYPMDTFTVTIDRSVKNKLHTPVA